MDRLRGMQKAFLTMALGGEDAYTGRDLTSAHAGLVERGLNDSHFDRFMKCLRQTLEELDIGEEIPETLYLCIAQVIAFAYKIQGKFPDNWEGKPL